MALTQVKSDGIATGAVTATQIAANAVTVDDIADGSISTAKLADANVTTAKLADDAVTADKLANTAVTAGSYGSASAIPAITVDAQGRITAASTNAISVESDRIFEGNTSAEAVDTGSDGHFKVVTEGTEAMRITAAQRVGIVNTNPGAALEVSSGDRNSSGQGGAITVGGNVDSTGVSNNTRKVGFINVPHYANATAKMALMIGDCQSSANEISIGGAFSNYTAATAIKFWTAANTTTTVGTERLRIASTGALGLSGENYGTSGQVLTSQGSGSAPQWASASTGNEFQIANVDVTGVSSATLTGIDPNAVKLVLTYENVSAGSSTDLHLRIGNSSGVTTSGYTYNTGFYGSTSGAAFYNSFIRLNYGFNLVSNVLYGRVVLNKHSSNRWIVDHTAMSTNYSDYIMGGVGYPTAGGTLDRIQIFTSSGTNFTRGTWTLSEYRE